MAGNKTAGEEKVGTTQSETSGQRIPATVVRVIDENTRIVQTLTSEKESVFCILRTRNRSETQEPLPDLQDDITINRMVRKASTGFPAVNWEVMEYRICERRNQEEWEEVVGVVDHDRSKRLISVVGRSFHTATEFVVPYLEELHHEKFGIVHDCVVGTVRRMKKTFAAKHMFGGIAIVKDWESVESSKSVRVCRSSSTQRFHVSQDCRYFGKELTLEQAELYIRDFHIAAVKMEAHVAQESAKYHTVEVNGVSYVDQITKEFRIKVFLNQWQKKKCINSTGQYAWRLGMELTMKHADMLEETNKFRGIREVAVAIDKINTSGKKTEVILKASARSEAFFQLMRKIGHVFDAKEKFIIGPSSFESSTVFENLDINFRDFFNDKERFYMWQGVTEPSLDEILDLYEKYAVNGTYLDRSQTIALRTAMARDGVTSVEAPPGSGKTQLLAAILGLKHDCRTIGATYISATTNAAIDNAVRVTNQCFPFIKISRNFSKALEGTLDEEMRDLSLCQQGLHYGKYVDPEANPQMANAMGKYHRVVEKLNDAKDLRTGLPLVQAKAGAQHEVKQRFYEAYRPEVFGATCELLARKETKIEKQVARELREGRHPKLEDLQQCGTHLILDEASQIPPYMALAMYVQLYAVKKITVIGDSKQLGPFSGLEEHSFVRQCLMGGELGRVQRGRGTSKVNLSTIYRCHPAILEVIYRPLYGPLSCGTTTEQRNMAEIYGLPTAKDKEKTPVLFVQTNGSCIDGYNKEEIDNVMNCLETQLKNVPDKDIFIICHHRQQRSKLIEELKKKKSSLPVNTVDSCQGMQAKIVLLLTTKTCKPRQNPHEVFRFVSDFNRETVAVTRAQHAMYIFGQWDQLYKTEFWRQYIPTVVEHRALVTSDFKEVDQAFYDRILALPCKE